MLPTFLLLLAAHLLAVAHARPIHLHNPPLHTANAQDHHDGPIVQWSPDQPFYRYSMAYTDCDLDGANGAPFWSFLLRGFNRFVEYFQPEDGGFDCGQIVMGWPLSDGFGHDCGFKSPRHGQTVRIHSSYDLHHWTLVQADALAGAPSWLRDDSILFRPAILFSPTTHNYVLWINHLPRTSHRTVTDSYRQSGFVVGTSSTPTGPFTFAEDGAMGPTMRYKGGADFSLLSVGDTAYIAYGSWHNYRIKPPDWRADWYPDWALEGHQIAIEELTPSFEAPIAQGRAITVTSAPQEAPAFFHRQGFYYLVHGDLCCFCRKGSDAKVLVAKVSSVCRSCRYLTPVCCTDLDASLCSLCCLLSPLCSLVSLSRIRLGRTLMWAT